MLLDLLKVTVIKLQPTALHGGLSIKYIQKPRPIPLSTICRAYAWKYNDYIAEVSSDGSGLQKRRLINIMTSPIFQPESLCYPVYTHNKYLLYNAGVISIYLPTDI